MQFNVHHILFNIIPTEFRWKFLLLNQWSDIIGSLEGKVHIKQIHEHVILLSVSHPCWAQELLMMSNMLKRKINKVIGCDTIKEIRFSYKSFVKHELKKKTPLHNNSLSDRQLSLLSSTMTNHETEALNTIQEPELQKILKKFYATCKRKQILSDIPT
ncbi:DUF721 domain-containing protein [Candidatus Babeliales bacterium]|nr:DUF721 domain-containing protein [Candidatus Babeliales bacterium]